MIYLKIPTLVKPNIMMHIHLHEAQTLLVAEVVAEGIILASEEDTLDIIGNCGYQGADHIIVHQRNIHPDFFDLKTNLAGNVLQKISNYRTHLAINGNFHNMPSKSLQDFIHESNRSGRVKFLGSVEEALKIWAIQQKQ